MKYTLRMAENSDDESCLEVELKESIDMRTLCSNQGAIFELTEPNEQQTLIKHKPKYIDNYHFDQIISDLNLGNSNPDGDDILDTGSDDDLDPFEKLAKDMVDISGDAKVLKKELYPGVGNDLPEGSTITFHYNAYFEYADEPFDSTYLRNKPQKCSLKHASVVPGLKIGLMTMRKKEKAIFLVKPEYAFGKMGCPPRIPADATIRFDVTLIDVIDFSTADDFESLDDEDRKRAPFKEKLEAAKAYHRKANAAYKAKNYLKAKDSYKKAIRTVEYCIIKDDEESRNQCEMVSKMYSNLAQVDLDLKQPARACTDCQNALDVPFRLPDDMKAKIYFRYAKAKMLLDDYASSHAFLKKVLRLRPNSADVTELLETLYRKEEKYKERERAMCRNIFKSYSHEVPNPINKTLPGKSQEDCSLTLVDVDVYALDENKSANVLNIRSEFEDAVNEQICCFLRNKLERELTLPSNLSTEELAHIFAAAKATKLKINSVVVGAKKHIVLRK